MTEFKAGDKVRLKYWDPKYSGTQQEFVTLTRPHDSVPSGWYWDDGSDGNLSCWDYEEEFELIKEEPAFKPGDKVQHKDGRRGVVGPRGVYTSHSSYLGESTFVDVDWQNGDVSGGYYLHNIFPVKEEIPVKEEKESRFVLVNGYGFIGEFFDEEEALEYANQHELTGSLRLFEFKRDLVLETKKVWK